MWSATSTWAGRPAAGAAAQDRVRRRAQRNRHPARTHFPRRLCGPRPGLARGHRADPVDHRRARLLVGDGAEGQPRGGAVAVPGRPQFLAHVVAGFSAARPCFPTASRPTPERGGDPGRPASRRPPVERAALPADHRAFLQGLELVADRGDYLCVHAGVRPGMPLDQQGPKRTLLWIRDDFLRSEKRLSKVIVHGHTPSEEASCRAPPHRPGHRRLRHRRADRDQAEGRRADPDPGQARGLEGFSWRARIGAKSRLAAYLSAAICSGRCERSYTSTARARIWAKLSLPMKASILP